MCDGISKRHGNFWRCWLVEVARSVARTVGSLSHDGQTVNWFRRIPMASLIIVVTTISAIGWVALDGAVPLVISFAAGGLITLRATLDDE